MYEFSVEQAADKIDNNRTKEYFREVMNSYFNGNYRSAIVMLWTVVICDLIYKLQYLKDIHTDDKAGEILSKVAELQANNPNNPKWEEELVEDVHARTQLLDAPELDALRGLHKHRHLSAHPVINKADILFRPTREMVLFDIRVALDSVLTKPPILTKQVFHELVEDLEKVQDIFPDNNQLRRYIESKYLRNLNYEVLAQIFKSLWRVAFKVLDERCDRNRSINSIALRILFEQNRESLTKCVSDNSAYFSEISDGSPLRHAIFFLGDYPHLYGLLTEATREILDARARTDTDLLVVSYFLSRSISEHIDLIVNRITHNHEHSLLGSTIHKNHILDLIKHAESAGIKHEVNKLLIAMYINAMNFDAADALFATYIRPYISTFTSDDVSNLLDGIANNNQTHWRGRADADHQLIVDQANKLDPKFDQTAYSFLPASD